MSVATAAAAGASRGLADGWWFGGEQRRDRPNIVILFADDMGFSDPGCFGGEIDTPNLDSLAKGGVRFSQFYNCSICGPSRASIQTGLYNQQVGVRSWNDERTKNGLTLAEPLHEAGYHTMMIGKWQGWPDYARDRGFDRFFGSNVSTDPSAGPGHYTRRVHNLSQWGLDYAVFTPPDEFYRTDLYTDYAVSFLDEAYTKDQPFFLFCAFVAPHWPLHADEADIAKYRTLYRDAGWDQLRADRCDRLKTEGLIDPGWSLTARDARVPAWTGASHQDWEAERMAVYAAQVDRLDRNIGRILQSLKDAGQYDNSLILFLSDNGASDQWACPADPVHWRIDGTPTLCGNEPGVVWPGPHNTFVTYGPPWANVSATPFRQYKMSGYEGGWSCPFLARWPGIVSPGTITHQPAHLMDVMPTLLDVAEAEYPTVYNGHAITPLEGKSLLPVLQGRQREEHEGIFFEYAGYRAVRAGSWKLVASPGQAWELYDMAADRTETNNVAGSNPGVVSDLTGRYNDWADRVGI